MELGLAEIISPLPLPTFLAKFWLRRAVVSANRNRGRFEKILEIGDVDGIAATLLQMDPLRVSVCRSRAVPVARTDPSRLNAAVVSETYRDGNTVLLTSVQDAHRPVARLCRSIEDSLIGAGVLLERSIGANLYLSPPGSSGFDPHYDDHDVLILQLGGRKTWRFFGPKEPFPLHQMKGHPAAEDLPDLQRETVLRSGSVAYIPRGHFHHAKAEDDYSIHLTLSIRPWTRLSLLERVFEQASGLRQSIPILNGDYAGLAADLAAAVRSIDLNADVVSDACGVLAREYFAGVTPLPDGAVGQIVRRPKLRLTARIAHRVGTFSEFNPDKDRPSLRFAASTFSGPPGLAAVFEFIARNASFCPGDLPDVLPDDAKIALTAELIRHGLLVAE